MNNKKIFCFVQLYHISETGGGAEVQAYYLSKELVGRGFIVHYICQTVNSNKINSSTKIDSVNIHWIKNRVNHSKNSRNEIFELLKVIQPNLIIERMSSAFGGAIIKYKKEFEANYIWICTDNESPKNFKNLSSAYQKLSILKFLYSIKKNYQIDCIRQKSINTADIIFTQNRIQQLLVQKNFNRDSKRMISGHPLPEKILTPDERFKKQTVLWAANMGKHKRPELLIELARRFESSPIRFVMVGGHSDKQYVASLGQNKPQNLILTGQLPFDETLKYFDESSILVNTSVSEGFSNTYIQAWLRGMPTVVFGADPDNVIDKNSLGFNAKNINEAEMFIKSLLVNENQYKEHFDRVINYAKAHHTIEVMTNNFIKQLKDEGFTLHQ